MQALWLYLLFYFILRAFNHWILKPKSFNLWLFYFFSQFTIRDQVEFSILELFLHSCYFFFLKYKIELNKKYHINVTVPERMEIQNILRSILVYRTFLLQSNSYFIRLRNNVSGRFFAQHEEISSSRIWSVGFAQRVAESTLERTRLKHNFLYDQLVDPETYLRHSRVEEGKNTRETSAEMKVEREEVCGNLLKRVPRPKSHDSVLVFSNFCLAKCPARAKRR